VKLFVQEAAERDILSQIEWYASLGLSDIARRFQTSVWAAIDSLLNMPNAGAPKPSRNPTLAGLRSWPVRGFGEHNIYYLAQPGRLTIVRVLHDKRDIGSILDDQNLEHPSSDPPS
jgi:plasmid stabilization system protein ParE